MELLKYYYLTGGMPEVVAKFVDQRDIPACRELQKEILAAYQLDFSSCRSEEAFKVFLLDVGLPDQHGQGRGGFHLPGKGRGGPAGGQGGDQSQEQESAGLPREVLSPPAYTNDTAELPKGRRDLQLPVVGNFPLS